MSIGSIFKKYRENQGLSQVKMGKLLGANDRYISRIENNKINPSYKIAANFIKEFDLKKKEREELEKVFLKEKIKKLKLLENELIEEKREIYKEKERIKSVSSIWTNRIEIKEKLINVNSTLQEDVAELLILISLADDNLITQIRSSIELTIKKLNNTTKELEDVICKKIGPKLDDIEIIEIK